MSRLDEIEAKARAIPFLSPGLPYQRGDEVSRLMRASIMNQLRDLVAVDIPWLLAEVRRLQAMDGER